MDAAEPVVSYTDTTHWFDTWLKIIDTSKLGRFCIRKQRSIMPKMVIKVKNN